MQISKTRLQETLKSYLAFIGFLLLGEWSSPVHKKRTLTSVPMPNIVLERWQILKTNRSTELKKVASIPSCCAYEFRVSAKLPVAH